MGERVPGYIMWVLRFDSFLWVGEWVGAAGFLRRTPRVVSESFRFLCGGKKHTSSNVVRFLFSVLGIVNTTTACRRRV